jgi:ArsR family metal-binding transcriptional regulator
MIKTIEDANRVIYEEKVNKLLSQEYKILFANYTGGKWIAIMENNEILNIYKNYQKKINEMWRLL